LYDNTGQKKNYKPIPMRLLLISNSTNYGEAYLEHAQPEIRQFLANDIDRILFIPYAAVTFTFDAYQQKVQRSFDTFGIQVESLHKYPHIEKKQVIEAAEAIVVGGGNTFQLLKYLHQEELIETIRHVVLGGVPYIGWSAGANVACPTLCTTNDMPITEPESFHALNLIRFQINPHYLDTHPEAHGGETREMRIQEFITVNPYVYTVGLREGSMFLVEYGEIKLLGDHHVRIFKGGEEPYELGPGDDFDFLFD